MTTNRSITDFLATHPFEPCYMWPADHASSDELFLHADSVLGQSLASNYEHYPTLKGLI